MPVLKQDIWELNQAIPEFNQVIPEVNQAILNETRAYPNGIRSQPGFNQITHEANQVISELNHNLFEFNHVIPEWNQVAPEPNLSTDYSLCNDFYFSFSHSNLLDWIRVLRSESTRINDNYAGVYMLECNEMCTAPVGTGIDRLVCGVLHTASYFRRKDRPSGSLNSADCNVYILRQIILHLLHPLMIDHTSILGYPTIFMPASPFNSGVYSNTGKSTHNLFKNSIFQWKNWKKKYVLCPVVRQKLNFILIWIQIKMKNKNFLYLKKYKNFKKKFTDNLDFLILIWIKLKILAKIKIRNS